MSDNDTKYGQLQSEKRAEENNAARQIVREINNFGITNRQRWMIMYLLALELEKVEEMKMATAWINDVMGHDLFLASHDTEDDGGNDGPQSSLIKTV